MTIGIIDRLLLITVNINKKKTVEKLLKVIIHCSLYMKENKIWS